LAADGPHYGRRGNLGDGRAEAVHYAGHESVPLHGQLKKPERLFEIKQLEQGGEPLDVITVQYKLEKERNDAGPNQLESVVCKVGHQSETTERDQKLTHRGSEAG
jgi:hypothetical protein